MDSARAARHGPSRAPCPQRSHRLGDRAPSAPSAVSVIQRMRQRTRRQVMGGSAALILLLGSVVPLMMPPPRSEVVERYAPPGRWSLSADADPGQVESTLREYLKAAGASGVMQVTKNSADGLSFVLAGPSVPLPERAANDLADMFAVFDTVDLTLTRDDFQFASMIMAQ